MARCLIIKNDGVGDLILSSHIINYISDRFDGNVDLLCCDASATIASQTVRARRLIKVSRDPHLSLPTLKDRWPHRAVRDIGRAVKNRPTGEDRTARARLAETTYDLAIVLRRYIRQSTFYFMSRVVATRRVSLWQYPTNLSVRRARHLSAGWEQLGGQEALHEFEYYTSALSSVFPGLTKLRLPSDPGTSRPEENTPVERIAVVLGSAGKGLTPKTWGALVDSLVARGVHVEVFGGRDTVRRFGFFERMQGVDLRAGNGSFDETAEYIASNFAVAIGNDTGLMHRVAPHLSKLVVVCSGETPLRFFPWPGATNQYVIYRSLPCFDCGYCTRISRACVRMDPQSLIPVVHSILADECEPGVIDVGTGLGFPVARRWGSGRKMTLTGVTTPVNSPGME